MSAFPYIFVLIGSVYRILVSPDWPPNNKIKAIIMVGRIYTFSILQSKFNDSNIYGTMEISSRHWLYFEPLRVNHYIRSGRKWG